MLTLSLLPHDRKRTQNETTTVNNEMKKRNDNNHDCHNIDTSTEVQRALYICIAMFEKKKVEFLIQKNFSVSLKVAQLPLTGLFLFSPVFFYLSW